MKIEQNPFQNLNELKPQYKKLALEGRFYHCERVFIVKTEKGYLAVAFNIFERIAAAFAKIVGKEYFKDKLGAKQFTILSSTDLRNIQPKQPEPLRADLPIYQPAPPIQPKIDPLQNPAPHPLNPPAAVLPMQPVAPAKIAPVQNLAPAAPALPAMVAPAPQPVNPPAPVLPIQPGVPAKIAPVQNPAPQHVNPAPVAVVQAIQPIQPKITTVPVAYSLINESANYTPEADLAKLNALARLFNIDLKFHNVPVGQKADIGLCVCLTPHRTLYMMIPQLQDAAKNLIIIAQLPYNEISGVPKDQVNVLKMLPYSASPDWKTPENRRSAILAAAKLLPPDGIKAVQQMAPAITHEREVRCGLIGEASKYKDNGEFVKKLNKLASLFNYKFNFKFEVAPQAAPTTKNIYDLLIMGPNVDKYAYWKYTADNFMVMDAARDTYQKYTGINQAKMSLFAQTLDWSKEWDDPAEFREALTMVLRLIPDQHLPAV